MGDGKKLSEAEVESALRELPGWSVANGKLLRNYAFGEFVKAWAFMSAAALVVNRLDHHPEWFNVYDRVRVELVTHAFQGIGSGDVELAKEMERLAAPLLAKS